MHTGRTGPNQTPLLLLSIFPSHLKDKDTYIRMFFIDYSSAFNMVIPHKLTHKLFALGLDHTPHSTTGSLRPQSVRIGNKISDTIITNISHCLSKILKWRACAALNTWGFTSARTSPGHSTPPSWLRKDNSGCTS